MPGGKAAATQQIPCSPSGVVRDFPVRIVGEVETAIRVRYIPTPDDSELCPDYGIGFGERLSQ